MPTIEYETYRKYELLVRCHIIPKIGHIKLAKLKPKQLQSFYATLLTMNKPLSKGSVLHIHNLLHEALERAVKWDLIIRKVTNAVDPPKTDQVEMAVWTEDQINTFLATAKTKRYYIAFVLAISTGMRKAEILGLHWHDIDLKRGEHSVTTTLRFKEGEPYFKATKTRKGRRLIPYQNSWSKNCKNIIVVNHGKSNVKGRLTETTTW